MIEKAAFRRACRRYRRGLSAGEREDRSTRILNRLETLRELAQARTVHTFWPIEDTGEIDTRPLIQRLLEKHRRVILPVVDFSSKTEPVLEHREFSPTTTLQTNRWGIPEPRGERLVSIDSLDLVIVPALGADRFGHRVGYGGGFYDRFLSKVSVPTVCLVYQACLTNRLAAESHDIRVSIVVTENEVIRPRNHQQTRNSP
jgi:5-formyltetrahydrofolate cyclo-ligase